LADGNYNFGFIDDTEHKGPIIYTPVDSSRGYWGFTSTGYSVGNDNFVYTNTDSIADTGTSLILLPNSTVQDYWSHVRSSYYDSNIAAIAFDCSESLPDFTFGVGDSSITVPGPLISYGYADDQGQNCFGGIQAISGLTLFGDVAMKAALVVFDDGNKRVGWAQK
jgi:aspergillopepsin I